MVTDPNRRLFLATASAATAAGAIAGEPRSAGAASAEMAYRRATDLVEALATRSVSSRELVDSAIARIEALDGKLNAVVVRDFAAARAADDALARGERRPLLGLPMTVKEQFEIDGKLVTYGDQLIWISIATLCGLPATVAPIERSETGLPVGVQIIGGYLEDRTTIGFAELIEREYGGFVAPPAL